jgi:hypothetical protein
MERPAAALDQAIRQWHHSEGGRTQLNTFRLPSWEYKHLIIKLALLPDGLCFAIGLILDDLERRAMRGEQSASAFGFQNMITYSSHIVSQHEWDQWAFTLVTRWCESRAQPASNVSETTDQVTISLTKDSTGVASNVFHNIQRRQRRLSKINGVPTLPLTLRNLYGHLRPIMVERSFGAMLQPRLPYELVTMVSDAYLASTRYKEARPGLVETDYSRCSDTLCCCNHEHVYRRYLTVWSDMYGGYFRSHRACFRGESVCDMHAWTCIGASRTTNRTAFKSPWRIEEPWNQSSANTA